MFFTDKQTFIFEVSDLKMAQQQNLIPNGIITKLRINKPVLII